MTTLMVILFLSGFIFFPIGLGAVAQRHGYSIPLFVGLGLLFGPGAFVLGLCGGLFYGELSSVGWLGILFSSFLGYVSMIVGFFLPGKAKLSKSIEVTLPMPLPPEQESEEIVSTTTSIKE